MHHHHHGHDHHHHAPNAADIVRSTFIIGIVLNMLYVITEVIAGLMTNSMALLSDAGHNLGDVAGLALSLFSFKLAKVKPTNTYTYGYKKTTILAALANAVILLIGIGVIGYESIVRLKHPEPVQGGVIAWIAALGILVNAGSALLFFRNKNEMNNKAAYVHLMSDAVVSVAVVIAGIIIKYTHLYWIDAAISIVVLLVILYSTWSLLKDSLRLTMDAVPESVDIDTIRALIENTEGVSDVHHMHIWAMSTTENALTTHLVLNDILSFEEKMEVVHHLKHELQHNNIQHATIELESGATPCENEDC
ncbi:MAG: cation transporter [Taibaiella sp.]|nr:cation transporter [Taibaiella sp.]